MPRPPRLHVPDAYYHVVLRGNHQEPLFGSPVDRRILNDVVAEARSQFDCRIHAFCWMTNHLHALVQVSEHPLGKLMQCIATKYSRYRHKALETSGHLFERRYKAKLVDVDAYFLTLLRYIHLNPVKAGIVNDPSEYPWSSHRAFLGVESFTWLTTDFGLALFSSDVVQARMAYKRFVLGPGDGDDGVLDQEAHPDDCRILGTDEFVSRIPVIPRKQRGPVTLEQLAESFCTERHIDTAQLRSPSRTRHFASIRVDFSTNAIERGIATVSEIARFLNRDPSSLAKLLARHVTNQRTK